ncbi:MAG: hypothetical protein WAW52_05230 [Methanothrix sp.]
MPVDLKGFDDLKRKADEAKRKGEAGVKLSELFHPDFMKKYTNFRSIDEMAKTSEIDIESMNDFDKIPEAFFRTHTKFSCGGEMTKTATEHWIAKNLGFSG